MGATSSINGMKNAIYVSYDYRQSNNLYIKGLCDELEKLNMNIIYSEITKESLGHLSTKEICAHIENVMNHTSYCIMCFSQETVRSFHQTIEINKALDSDKPILYLMLDKHFTPLNNMFIKGIVKKDIWLPLYYDDHMFDCMKFLEIELTL